MPPKHATTARLKMSCTCEGCFKPLWCPHSCHWIITEVKTSYFSPPGHLAPPGHPSHAGLSRAGEISLLTTLFFSLIYSAYIELPMFSCHILSPNVQNIAVSTAVWNRLPCTPVIFHQKLFHWSLLLKRWSKSAVLSRSGEIRS